MKKTLLAFLLLAVPATAFASPVSWEFSGGILQPLQSGWSALAKAARFQATSTTASIFPYASTTALSGTTLCLSSDCRTSWPSGGSSFAYPFPANATSTSITFNAGLSGTLTGNASTATALAANPTNCSAGNYPLGIDASGNVENCTAASGSSFSYPFPGNATSTLIAFNAGLTASGLTIGALSGVLKASAGVVSGGASTTDVPEGSNLYWTTTRFDNRLSATTSLPNITTLAALSLPYSQLTGTPNLFSYPFPSNATSTSIAFNAGLTASAATIGSGSGLAILTSGVVSSIPGTTCTSQFLRAFTSSGGTCATVVLGTDTTGSYVSGLVTPQGTTASAVTLATSTLSFNGLTLGIKIVGGISVTFSPTVTGTLTAGGGGTGVATFGGTNHILYTTAADTLASEAAFTYDATADRLTTSYASTTAQNIATLFGPTAASTTLRYAGMFSIQSGAGSSSVQYFDGTAQRGLYDVTSISVTYTNFPTSGTGTTTRLIKLGSRGIAFTGGACTSVPGTANVQLGNGTASTTGIVSSTGLTSAQTAFSANNDFNSLQTVMVAFGNFSSSGTTTVSCSYDKRYRY